MKKLVVYSTLLAVLCGAGLTVVSMLGGTEAALAQEPSMPHKIALIDMAHVFKKYKKFEEMREGLFADIQASEDKIKQEIEVLKTMQEQMKKMVEGTPQYKTAEQELAKKAADIRAYKDVQQRDFARRESQIYKSIYNEVTAAVTKYAEYYKYTLVMRFKRDDIPTSDTQNDIMSMMNTRVIYHQPEDDITDAVLDFLNRSYKGKSVVPTSGTK